MAVPYSPPRCVIILIAWLLASSLAWAKPRKVMVIGDSLSREYQFTFSAFEEARNWVEILQKHRTDVFDFGDERRLNLSFISDALDLNGFRYNLSVPTISADQYRDLITGTGFDDQLFQNLVLGDIGDVDTIVVFLGGNDIDRLYSDLYQGRNRDDEIKTLRRAIESITKKVREENRDAEIVLANVPHVGATPEVKGVHPTDPVKTGRASAAIRSLNDDLQRFAESEEIAYADIYAITENLLDAEYLCIGGVPFINDEDANGKRRYAWLGGDLAQGFHPNTNGQALIANAITEALNTTYEAGVDLLSDREIVVDVVGEELDLAFEDWVDAFDLPSGERGWADDLDGDGVKNRMEFALGLDPWKSDPGKLPVASIESSGGNPFITLTFTERAIPCDYVTVVVEHSPDLRNWAPVARGERFVENPDGSTTAWVPTDQRSGYLRVRLDVAAP